jgi:hypothetical protein
MEGHAAMVISQGQPLRGEFFALDGASEQLDRSCGIPSIQPRDARIRVGDAIGPRWKPAQNKAYKN